MREILSLIFTAYYEAVKMFNEEISKTPIEYRTRGLEASYFNSKLNQCIGKVLGDALKRGKYGRRFLYKNGYIILFKKLKSNNMPMNIPTRLTEAIRNQKMGNLFGDDENGCEPILFFGYTKSKFGEICNPRIVYIDEEHVKWMIDESTIHPNMQNGPVLVPEQPSGIVTVKSGAKKKRKAE